jgi:hypothetical protein
VGLKMRENYKLPAQEWLGYDPERGDIYGYTLDQIKEFADSIVRECALVAADRIKEFADSIVQEAVNVVNSRYMGDNNREDMEVRRCVEDLKKHFGVEE